MKKKPLTEYTNGELQKEIKNRRFFFGVSICGIMLMIGIAFGIYLKKHEYNFNMVLPLFFIPMAGSLWSEYQKAKNELDNRKKTGK